MSATSRISFNEDEGTVSFGVEVRVPLAQTPAFAAALTGNDDDVILAAETAIRERLGREWGADEVELWPGPTSDELRAALCNPRSLR